MPRHRHPKPHPFGSILHGPPPAPLGGPPLHESAPPHHAPPHHHGPHHPPHVEWPYNIDEPTTLSNATAYLVEIFSELGDEGHVALNDDVAVSPSPDVHLVFRYSMVDGMRALETALIWKTTEETETGTTTLASALAARRTNTAQTT
jgi:hypothetical protein